jgi:hypothetical protein
MFYELSNVALLGLLEYATIMQKHIAQSVKVKLRNDIFPVNF